VPPAALDEVLFSDYEQLKDAGHFLHLEQPGRINDHILS
jgi:pimeloyl-ACP methyl ester carboxylesterase